MSKPVRIKDFVADRVEEVASSERRSFANMVEVLLLAALAGRDGAVAKVPEVVAVQDGKSQEVLPTGRASRPASVVPAAVHDVPMRPHMKKHRPAVECPARVPAGGVCPECGAVV